MANPGSYRYGPYRDGPDPLAAPFDVRVALDEMSDAILGGSAPTNALQEALRRGFGNRRALASYQWRSDAARETFERLKDLLRREVLDSQFRGMKDALSRPDPAALQRVKDMMSELSAMLEADARGEHRQPDFDEFMRKYG